MKTQSVKIKKSNRLIALTLVLIFCNTFLPYNILYANNNGPTAPEAATFEPVDAPDMVNLVTGDLSYVLPVLNVPSPEGGYPLALSYHAGIAMDQEATWVGLGWNLNPGALNRSVNGFPDDWKDSRKTNMVYDIGGEAVSNTLSLSAGWGGGGKISIGLLTSWGSNRAFGGETTHFSGFGGGISVGGVGLSLSSSESGVGISLNTPAGNVAISKVGGSKGSNSASVPMSFTQSGFSIGLTLQFTGFYARLQYSKKKTRYWSYDKKSFSATGSLYAGDLDEVLATTTLPFLQDFDSYEIQNGQSIKGVELENNFAAIAYDNYSASGQGISMTLSPLLSEMGSLFSSGKNFEQKDGNSYNYTRTYLVDNFTNSLGKSTGINFYVDNEYSSYLSLSANLTHRTPSGTYYDEEDFINSIDLEDNELNTTVIDDNGIVYDNYDANKKRIEKGSYIEAYTNREIINSNLFGFHSSLPTRANYDPDGIGGFKITTVDGKTYYYSLPVYQHEKFDRSSSLEHNIDEKFFEQHSLDSYATHWLLTAITGPDFIDVNSNYNVDQKDFGYWVTFEYGKWSDGYTWRTPTTGYQENEATKTYGWGSKEIYYLDKISTRTHTALFVKGERKDNLSSEITIGNGKDDRKWYTQLVYGWSNSYIIHKGTDENYYVSGLYSNFAFPHPLDIVYSTIRTDNSFYYQTEEQESLLLKEIILLKNKDLPIDFSKNNEIAPILAGEMFFTERGRAKVDDEMEYDSGDQVVPGSNKVWKGHFYNKIIDEGDISSTSVDLHNIASKVIEFQYDYSSFKGVDNSKANTNGKLTLKKLWIKGRGGIRLLPPYRFDYLYSSYNRNNMDSWGYTSYNPMAGSLHSIITPTGATINISYESDDYYEEAAIVKRVFNNGLKFTFYEYNGKLRFDIEKDSNHPIEVNFSDYFRINEPVLVDIWACLKREYNQWGCQTRTGTIDIPSEKVNVVSVSHSKVTFETNLSFTSSSNDGLNWLYGASPMGTDFSDYIMQQRKRGACPDLSGGCSERTRLNFRYKIFAVDAKKNRKGGGVRVKQIETKIGNTMTHSKSYFYNTRGYQEYPSSSGYRSSGITSYAPSKHKKDILYTNELPRPNVMYSRVKVLNNDGSYNTYMFETLTKAVGNKSNFSLGSVLKITAADSALYNSSFISMNQLSKINIKKYEENRNFSAIGRLKEISTFNSQGQLVKQLTHNYKDGSSNQGVIEETFKTHKRIINNDEDRTDFNLNITSIKSIPTVLESTTIIENGYSSTTFFDDYDFNSGELLKSRTFLSDGTVIRTSKFPAYKFYPQMGSKVDNIFNKNMLSQKAATVIQIGVGETWRTTNSSITTWNNEWSYYDYDGSSSTTNDPERKIWRKHKNFIWNGELNQTDGTYIGYSGDFDGFNWTVGAAQTNPEWINTNTVTAYDHYSMPLEQRDINGNFISTKMGDKESKVFSVSNAPYLAQFYSGAEDLNISTNYFGGQVYKGSTATLSNIFHTGSKGLRVNANVKAFAVKPNNGNYKASVWVYKHSGYNYLNTRLKAGSRILDYTTGETIHAGNWVQLNFNVDNLAAGQEVYVHNTSGTAIYDDFRMHPVTSSLTSYVYNQWDELTYVLEPNNMAIKYEYDAAGRLVRVYQEVKDEPGKPGGFKLATEMDYNHKRTAKMDTNDNGVIDQEETYDPLQFFVSLDDPPAYSTTARASVSGGSGDYSYRWATGNDLNMLSYGNWTSIDHITFTNPCPDGTQYYKCQVRDNETLTTRERQSLVFRNCDGGQQLSIQ